MRLPSSSETGFHQIRDLLEADVSVAEAAEHAVEIGAETLGVDHGYFTRIVPQLDHWEAVASTDDADGPVPVGEVLNLQTTFCRHVVDDGGTFVLGEGEGDASDRDGEWTCYITTRIEVDGELYGSLCFADSSGRKRTFEESDRAFVECLTGVLGQKITLNEREITLSNRNQLLEVLSRVLRHNFRNDLTLVQGHVGALVSAAADLGIETDALESTVERLLSLTQKSRELHEIAQAEPRFAERQIMEMVEGVRRAFAAEYPHATVRLTAPEGVTLTALPTVETAVRELVENAVTHAGPYPVCDIAVEARPDDVRITLTDNGPGLPTQDRKVLEGGSETALSHGSGVGLWIVRWVMNSHDGSVTASVADGGTEIVLTLPRPMENADLIAATAD
ncbi:MAG: ATP-binding protein [Halolamina sp.]